MSQAKKIVILGAGFAGVRVMSQLYRSLATPAEITLINDHNYFLFTPLLHEVATGGLFPENVVMPLRPLAKCCGAKFIQAGVKSVNLQKRLINTVQGDVVYDYLVLALGGATNFYNIVGAEKYSFGLKTLA